MAAIVESIEIACRPEDVFAFATDFAHASDWQGGVVSASPEDVAPPSIGAKAHVTQRVGPRQMQTIAEITELTPPRTWAVRGVGGPIVAIVRGAIEPLAGGVRSRVTIALDFEGRGMGKLLVALVIRRQARKVLPINLRKLKELLEERA